MGFRANRILQLPEKVLSECIALSFRYLSQPSVAICEFPSSLTQSLVFGAKCRGFDVALQKSHVSCHSRSRRHESRSSLSQTSRESTTPSRWLGLKFEGQSLVLLDVPAFIVTLEHRDLVLSVEKFPPSTVQRKQSPTDAGVIVYQAALALNKLKEKTHARPRVGLFSRMNGSGFGV